MTAPKKKSKALKSSLSAAVNFQKGRMTEAQTYMDFLKGKQYEKTPGTNEVTFNICHTTIQAILNSVMRGDPYIFVEPDSEEAVPISEYLEKIVNYWWRKLKIKYQSNLAVTDYAGLGLGVLYTDWDMQMDGNVMIKDEPFVLHVPFEDFLIDPNFVPQEIMEAAFMIRRFIKPLKELQKDTRYKYTKDLKGDVKLDKDIWKDDAEEQINLYQIWVPNDEASYVMRKGSDDILREVENKLGREYPFTLMQNYQNPGEQLPSGELKLLLEPQKTLNRIASLVVTHAQRVATRQFTANDQVKKEDLVKLKDAIDGEVIMIEGNAKASDVIMPIQDAPLSADVYQALSLLQGMVVQLSSISEYRRSSMPDEQRKATEAVYVEQGTELSINSKGEDVAKGNEDVARKIYQLITYDENIQTSEVTYKDEHSGNWVVVKYNNSSFPGEYMFRWESGNEGPINQAQRQQKAANLLKVISEITTAHPELNATLNWKELLKSTLTDFEMKNMEQVLSPPEEPLGGGGAIDPNTGQPVVDPNAAANVEGQVAPGTQPVDRQQALTAEVVDLIKQGAGQ